MPYNREIMNGLSKNCRASEILMHYTCMFYVCICMYKYYMYVYHMYIIMYNWKCNYTINPIVSLLVRRRSSKVSSSRDFSIIPDTGGATIVRLDPSCGFALDSFKLGLVL